jgi:large subunit ribosomal protein L13
VKTYIPKPGDIEKKWYVIDAEGKSLGRVAAEAAKLLRGKHKPQYTPFLDCGDHVIVLNAAKALVTGNKAVQKVYYRHSGYPGGLKEITYREMLVKHPTRPMTIAIKGMLPHNSLGSKMLKNCRVYAGADHKQEAQNPQMYEVK